MDREEAERALASGEFVLLAFPTKTTTARRFPASHYLVVKRADRVRAKEQPFLVDSPSDGMDAVEALGLYLARCGKVEGYAHLFADPERRRVVARLREREAEALLG